MEEGVENPTAEPESPLHAVRDIAEKWHPIKSAVRRLGKFASPNRITASRLPFGAAAIALQTISKTAATTVYTLNAILDWADGAVARGVKNGQTVEGARLDPLVDKAVNMTTLAALVTQHIHDIEFCAAAALSLIINIASQAQRGPLGGQIKEAVRSVQSPESCTPVSPEMNMKAIRANAWGKMKLILESVAIGTMMAFGDNQTAEISASIGLAVSALLGLVGVMKRGHQKTDGTK